MDTLSIFIKEEELKKLVPKCAWDVHANLKIEYIIEKEGFGKCTEVELKSLDKQVKCLSKRKTGQWIPDSADGYADGNLVYDVFVCSECGEEYYGDEGNLTPYCPYCGAKMEFPNYGSDEVECYEN